jgi:hypothetical protein
MSKLFIAWSTAIVTLMATANHQGYTAASLFSASQTADKSVNRFHK